MRFIGNKELITSEIKELLEEQGLTDIGLTLFDAFCGTGAISDALKDSFNIVSNDMLRWCAIYTRGRVCANDCTFDNLGFDPFEYFNSNKKLLRVSFIKIIRQAHPSECILQQKMQDE